MKICVLTTSYPRYQDDDAGIFVKRLVNAFDECGQSGTVIVPLDSSEPPRESQGAFEVLRFRYGLFTRGKLAFGAGIVPNIKRNPSLVLQIPGLLICMIGAAVSAIKKSDVIYANWLFSGLCAWVANMFARCPYFITIRGSDMKLLTASGFRWLWKMVLSGSSGVITVNSSFREKITQLYKIDPYKVVHIPNGVEIAPPGVDDVKKFLSERGLPAHGQYVVSVCTVTRGKRVDDLIRAIGEATLCNMSLIVCGRTEDQKYLSELKELALSLGCSARVRFEGAVAPREIPLYLCGAAAYVTASESEGRPNSVLEAMCAGVPIIASDIPGHQEILTSGVNGLLYKLGDAHQCAQSVRNLLDDKVAARKLAQEAATSVGQLSWKAAAHRYLDFFASNAPI